MQTVEYVDAAFLHRMCRGGVGGGGKEEEVEERMRRRQRVGPGYLIELK
jgi:hypothetical protein